MGRGILDGVRFGTEILWGGVINSLEMPEADGGV